MDDFMNNLAREFPLMELQHFQKFCWDKTKRATLDEKIQLVYEFLTSTNAWPRMEHESFKSAAAAIEFRLLGNAAFQAKQFGEALLLYTESVVAAPDGSEELAFAYANRSAVLITLRKYHDCLLDINRAFKQNYPEAGKQKLKDRKRKCVTHLRGAIVRISVHRKITMTSSQLVGHRCKKRYLSNACVHQMLMTPHLVDTGVRERSLPPLPQFSAMKKDMEEFSKTYHPENTDLPSQFPMPKVDSKNKNVPNASDKIKLKNFGGNKIGVVATANIKPGEILAIEKPVAWNLSTQFNRNHCANCFTRSEALIHCPNCCVVMFCSARCRDNAFELFHRIECQIFCKFALDGRSGIWENWMPVRLLLVVTKQGEELDQLMNHPVYKQPFAKTLSYNLQEFKWQGVSSVLCHPRLTFNNNAVNDYSTDIDLPAIRTVLLWIHYLRQSSFFNDQGRNENSDRLTNRELYVATLLLKLTQTALQYVTEELKAVPGLERLTIVPIGCGLFPLMNFFRHSCEPHVNFYCYQNNLVCRAIRPIKAGEEILVCYFRPYDRCPRYVRSAQLLEKYEFECTCRPCKHNWPILDDLPHGFPKVISDVGGAKKLREYSTRMQVLADRVDLDKLATSETFEFLSDYLSILDKRFEKPCREFLQCERLLDLSMSLKGNFYNLM